jgi:hypothetical protein
MSTSESSGEPETTPKPVRGTPVAPPDPEAVLADTAARHYATFWGGKAKNPVTCPICGADEWTILPVVDLPVRYMPDQALTAAPVQCENCKYLVFFNAVAAGFFGPDGLPADMPRDFQPPSDGTT